MNPEEYIVQQLDRLCMYTQIAYFCSFCGAVKRFTYIWGKHLDKIKSEFTKDCINCHRTTTYICNKKPSSITVANNLIKDV